MLPTWQITPNYTVQKGLGQNQQVVQIANCNAFHVAGVLSTRLRGLVPKPMCRRGLRSLRPLRHGAMAVGHTHPENKQQFLEV